MTDFDKFWQVYPKKKSKLHALAAWKRLRPSSDLVVAILDAVEKQKQSEQWQKDGGQFIPYPATWLNAGCWMDEEVEPPREKTAGEIRKEYEGE